MPVHTENQSQLTLLSIFAEHPDTLLFKLASQIAEVFAVPPDRAQEVFDMAEFSQVMKAMRKEWLIEIHGAAWRDDRLQFSKEMAYDIWVSVERRGSESVSEGKIAPSAISNRRPRNSKPSMTSDTIRDLLDRKVKQLRKPTSQHEAIEKIAASIAA